jgi:hypothetical protein
VSKVWWLLVLMPLCGCARIDAVASGPVEAVGTYELQLVYRENGCGFSWPEEGRVLSGVELTVRPGEGAALEGEIGGAVGLFIGVSLGRNTLLGEIDHGRLLLRLDGRYSSELAGCAFVVGFDADTIVSGDDITGTLVFRRRLPESDLCDVARCESVMTFVGRRRPLVDASVSDAGVVEDALTDAPPSD